MSISKSEINRCGKFLAEMWEGEPTDALDWDQAAHAYAVVSDYRAAHQQALSSLTMGLRSMVRSEGMDPLVSQRLKRLPRIVRKLARMQNSNLARLEDIGGCRAIVPDADAMKRLRARVEHRWGPNIVRRRDYVSEPNAAGYRAHHYVVQRHERRIEVQLRTVGQQAWADAVEAADSRYNLTLKDGRGPESMLRYFTLANQMIYSTEYGVPLDPGVGDAFDRARARVIEEGYYRKEGA